MRMLRWAAVGVCAVIAACGRVAPPELAPCGDAGIATLGHFSSVVALDDAHVFVESGGGTSVEPAQIQVMPAGGGPASVLVEATNGTAIGLDADRVYFTNDSQTTLAAIPKTGGAVVTLATNGGPYVDTIVTDEDRVYVSSHNAGVVQSVPKSGGAFTELATGASAHVIALDDSNLYFSTSTETYGDPQVTIESVPKAGGPPTTIFASSGYLRGTAADAGAIYFVIYDPSAFVVAIQRIDESGGAAQVLRSDAADSPDAFDGWQLAVDSGLVFLARKDAIWTIPVAGGDPQPTAAVGKGTDIALGAVGGGEIYFLSSSEVSSELEAVCE